MSSDAGFASFYEQTAPGIYAFAFLLAGSAGEDLAAEAYARALVRWNEIGGYARPDAWVRRVMINLAISRHRKQRLQSLFLQRGLKDDAPAAHEEQTETRMLVRAALDELSPRQRAVVILRYFGDLSLEETARALGCTASTANTHLRRARSRLGSLIGKD